jgi:hypothetical protein
MENEKWRMKNAKWVARHFAFCILHFSFVIAPFLNSTAKTGVGPCGDWRAGRRQPPGGNKGR